jgi:hypothetical protein
MREKLQEYALIAEIIGGLAVVLSLVYVGFQIQLNTSERRADSIESLNTGYRELALTYVEIEAAGVAWHKMLEGEDLTKQEVNLMSDALFAHLMLLEDTFNKHAEGYISDEFLESRTSLEIMRITLSPEIRQVYEGMKLKRIYTASFIEWLDGEIQKIE